MTEGTDPEPQSAGAPPAASHARVFSGLGVLVREDVKFKPKLNTPHLQGEDDPSVPLLGASMTVLVTYESGIHM